MLKWSLIPIVYDWKVLIILLVEKLRERGDMSEKAQRIYADRTFNRYHHYCDAGFRNVVVPTGKPSQRTGNSNPQRPAPHEIKRISFLYGKR
jgi:hypothetical protein